MNENMILSQETDDDEITIDLGDVLRTLWRKAHLILLVGILTALLAFVATKLFVTPMYTSVTKVYVLTKQNGTTSVTSSDLQAGSYLTKDYIQLVKSRPVMEQVIAVLGLDMKPAELSGMVSASAAEDTRILTISAQNADPKLAKEIADAVRQSVSVQITEIMDADAVNTVEVADLPETPSSPNMKMNVAIGGALGMILVMGIIILIYILDDTIKTPDDVEKYLDSHVLTSIPIAEGTKKAKKTRGLSARKFTKKMNKR